MVRSEILVAEDDPTLRNLYVKKFSLFGYAIRTAEDGEQVVREIVARVPDLLLCDLNMPRMNGMQVLEYFPRNRRTFPIIVLTNYADEQSRAKAEELGADDYFDKKHMTICSLVDLVERITMAKLH